MLKIAICGKANSGKNTTAQLLSASIKENFRYSNFNTQLMAFADPIKEMISLMFPYLNKDLLYGPSKLRAEIIPEAFKDKQPLTIRQSLIDLGTGVGRSYNEDIWINAFKYKFNNIKTHNNIVIVTDIRFINEFNYLKSENFYVIKLLRDSELKINHSSETNQDSINDRNFDYILYNNGTLSDLKIEVHKIAKNIVSLQV